MKRLAALLLATVLATCFGRPAAAENCTRSLDYILNDLAGDLPRPVNSYRTLLQTCLETLKLGNVQDAYILKDGGIAVIPVKEDLLATADTLAQFCRQFPNGSLRFITRRDRRHGLTTGLVVLMSSTGSDSCSKIR